MLPRNTWQSECILNCLKENSEKHLTIQNLEELLRQKSLQIGTTTLYRHLNKLVASNIVRKFKIDGQNSACYQYVDNKDSCCSHFHLICSECSKIVHFQCKEFVNILTSINNKNDFKIDLPKTIFYGICKECINKLNLSTSEGR